MDGKTEFEKKFKKFQVIITSNDKVIGPDFSMFELFFSSENQRADYSKSFRILEEGLKNYRNHYQEK